MVQGLANLPIAAALVDERGSVVETNAAFSDLFGPPPSGATWTLQAFAMDMAALTAARGKGLEVSVSRADGSTLDVLLIAGDGDSAPVILTFVDVTDRAQRERQLAELSNLPLVNPAPVLRFDLAGRVVMANPAVERLFGTGLLVGQSWQTICPGMTEDLWRAAAATEEPLLVETRIGDEEVEFLYVRVAGVDMVSAFGQVVTSIRQAQRELEEKAAQLTEMARFPDMNPGPVIRTDAAGIILLANIAARETFGVELLGQNWTNICSVMNEELWTEIVVSNKSVPVEARLGGSDYVFTHVRDPETGLMFVYGADISHQKQTEVALRQSEKMATLGTLAAGVAHELNNPAAATRRAAEQLRDKLAELERAHLGFNPAAQSSNARPILDALLERVRGVIGKAGEMDAMLQSDREDELEDWLDAQGVPDPWQIAGDLVSAEIDAAALAPLAEHLNGEELSNALIWLSSAFNVSALTYTVAQGSTRISEIVGALKGYSYLGQAPIQEVDLRDGLENTLIILRNKLKYGITVHRDYAPDLPAIPAYGSELNQVWTNLIDNAASAMEEKGNIRIRTRREETFAVVEIEDDGPGIPPEIQSRVFDPFFTTKPPGKGQGLGLSTCHSIIAEKHAGQIVVSSEPGSTRFVVKLPLQQPSPDAEKDGEPTEGPV
ncbi:MAG: PAS domain-containing protein [Hyphomicrobiales bacterium]|nr:PAS domain-containing protein [Hyphomicrobiales bacterium]